ncbi:NAD(P)H-hydrate dehydratase [Candidatus Sumerlaeota bacterium]|nr:NAD(P)H-hydrate dehydratase [Candidatus Sumerlaeota bacterium]
MMKVVTAEQMRRIDEVTIRERGIAGGELMERAGREVAREILERFSPQSAAIVAGKGNNGGDGFIAARHLHESGVHTVVYALFPPDQFSTDARRAFDTISQRVKIEFAAGLEAESPRQILADQLRDFDVVVDAILGTGTRGAVAGHLAGAIEAINASRVPVVAVDLPSGLAAEARQSGGPAVRAAVTITIGLPKLGLVVDPGMRSCGIVSVADIGFPRDLLDDPSISVQLTGLEDAAGLLPRRDPAGHKGTFGKTMILAGSEGMTGAAVLAARAAARSGVGLVYAAYPRPLGTIMESHLVEPVKLPLTGETRWFESGHAKQALAGADGMQSVALGPGIGQRPETSRFVEEIIRGVKAPLVIDADGLNLIAAHPEGSGILRRRISPTILTPHPGEAARLLGLPVSEIESDRLGAMLSLASQLGIVIVLKGAQTIVTAPDGRRFINPTGNSGLAKGGSGDVLTGLIAGLLGQGLSPLNAALLGVFVHGLAADRAALKQGVRAMIPGDIIETLGEAFIYLEKSGA